MIDQDETQAEASTTVADPPEPAEPAVEVAAAPEPEEPTFKPKSQADWARINRARRVDGVVIDFEEPESWFGACPRIRADDGPQMASIVRRARRAAMAAENRQREQEGGWDKLATDLAHCAYEHQRESNIAIAVAAIMGGGKGETTYLDGDQEVTFSWGDEAETVRFHARKFLDGYLEGPKDPGPLNRILAASEGLGKPDVVTNEAVWDFLSSPGSACGVRSALEGAAGNKLSISPVALKQMLSGLEKALATPGLPTTKPQNQTRGPS